MPNNIDDLRDHLFDTLKALKDEKNPMDVSRAKAISEVAGRIIDTAKVENDHLKLTGATGSGFIPVEPPKPGTPRLVKGTAQSGSK